MKFWKRKTRQFFALIMTAILFAGNADYAVSFVSAKEASEHPDNSDETIPEEEKNIETDISGEKEDMPKAKDPAAPEADDNVAETVLPETTSDGNNPDDSADTALLQSDMETPESEEGVVTEVTGELIDLGDTFTSAPGGISLFSLSDGTVDLKNGSHVNWIDRIDLPDYAINFYNTLVEASDNDGIDDFLIEDRYFSAEDAGTAIETSAGVYHGILVQTLSSPSQLSSNNPEYRYVQKCIRAVYDAFDRDHPEVFWLNGNTSAYVIEQGIVNFDDYSVSYKYNFYFLLQRSDNNGDWSILSTMYPDEASIKNTIQKRDNNISQILSDIQSGPDNESQIKALNDWLTKHNEYNTNLEDARSNYPDAWKCVSALKGLTGTVGPACEGYSRAFKVLCDKLGIPCVLVDGNAQSRPTGSPGGHMWNYVELNGNWYAVDVTWNDPTVSGKSGAVSGSETEKWLLLCSDSSVADNWTFIQSHPVENRPSVNGVEFTNGPQLITTAENNKINLSTADITLTKTNYIYNGKPCEPEITVTLNGQTLTKDVNYTVSYENNINVGTATVTVTAKRDCRGKVVKNFTIEKAANTITLPKNSYTYSASPSSAQTFSIGAKATGGSVTYQSSSTSVTVNASGKVTIPKNFAGTVTITVNAPENTNYNAAAKKTVTLQVNQIANTITASNFTKTASTAAQSFSIGAKRNGSGKLTYSSNNKSVTVDSSGKVTIAKNFTGKATITIKAASSGIYKEATKTITVTVNQTAGKITASNFTKTTSAKAQSFSIKAKRSGSGKLTYRSNNKSVTVNSSGKVTIAKNFVGKATVTIKAAASGIYKAATKTITVTVNPANTSISSVKNSASRKMTATWKKNTAVTGYQIQYSTNKSFKTGVKIVTVNKNRTVSTTVPKLTKGKTYYVRIRTYKTVSGTKYYSNWSGFKTVKIKK